MTKVALEASLGTLDTLIQIFAVIVAIGIVGEVGFGVRHWVLNRRLQAVQHAEDQAQQLQLAELRNPRIFSFPIDKFIASLKSKPTGRVDIMYKPDDGEASMFAMRLWTALAAAGWEVPQQPIPIPAELTSGGLRDASPDIIRRFPSVERVGGQPTGVSVVARSIEGLPYDGNTPFAALMSAFIACRLPVGAGRDESLPENVFRLVVGSKL